MYLASREFKWVINHHLIPSCPVTRQDITAAEKICSQLREPERKDSGMPWEAP